MPLHRPALVLGPGPQGVQDARRWVSDVCAGIGRPDLVDCARLGVSELVTNALLHGTAPIELRLRGTHEHPRVEVRDASTEPPVLPTGLDHPEHPGHPGHPEHPEHPDDLPLTVGRGLGIVARSASAWGADLEPDGKVVWFEPRPGLAEDAGVEGVVTGVDDPAAGSVPAVRDPVEVRVVGVPLRAYATFSRHLRELRREVRLLALAHESTYPLAKDLSDLFGSFERHLRDVIGTVQLEHAMAQGHRTIDLEVRVARSATQTMTRLLDLLDLADQFCREERLLALAQSDEQRRFQRWLLGEFIRQGDGEQPVPWSTADTELEPQPGTLGDIDAGSGRRSVVS